MSTCTTIYKYVKDVKVLDNNQISKNYNCIYEQMGEIIF